MVLENTSLVWLTEVIAHEWVHNYLAFRPLGWNYSSTPELRTMNETTASLFGLAIGREVLQQYYPGSAASTCFTAERTGPCFTSSFRFPELKCASPALKWTNCWPKGEIVDSRGVIWSSAASFFWENGYRIRKLNQAYFAFYGAYADEPGGAAGDDPVGEAVRTLWERTASPADFLRTMARMNTYEELLAQVHLPAAKLSVVRSAQRSVSELIFTHSLGE